jgi:hypothetical protein
MIKNKITFKNQKAVITITAIPILLVVSIATLGSAQFSNQQQEEQQQPDLASSSDSPRNGNVQLQTNDLDFSAGQAGGGQFELQTTERSNTITATDSDRQTVSVQCNSDEVVTGGGFSFHFTPESGAPSIPPLISESKKQDNGWSASWIHSSPLVELTAYAECLKVVNAEGTTG